MCCISDTSLWKLPFSSLISVPRFSAKTVSHLSVFPRTNPHHSEVSEKQNRLLPVPAAIPVIPTSPWLCPTLILPCHSVNIFSSVGAKQWVYIYSWHICDEHTEFYQWGSQTPVGFRIMGQVGGGVACLKHRISLSPPYTFWLSDGDLEFSSLTWTPDVLVQELVVRNFEQNGEASV